MTSPLSRDGRGLGSISLIVPMYNPGTERLKRTLCDLGEFATGNPKTWEFVFVCDGCSDGSMDVLRSWKPKNATTRTLSYHPNRGKGYAVRQGLLAASGLYRIFTDVDLAYPFSDIVGVANRLVQGDDVVVASRTHAESRIQIPEGLIGYVYRRQVQSRVFARLVRTLLPLSIGDTQAGLKGISAHVARTVVPYLRCEGFGFDCELLTACVRNGLTIVETPVSVRYQDGGSTTNWRATLRMVKELWTIRKNWPASRSKLELSKPSLREAG